MSTASYSWSEYDDKLEATFVFPDFKQALAFVNEVGLLAEEMQHHPDICIRNYNTVTIETTTHDADSRVTEKDQALAEAISAAADKRGAA